MSRNQLLFRELAPGKKTEVWRIYCPELFGTQYVLVTNRGWTSAKNSLFRGDDSIGKVRYSETFIGDAGKALLQPWSFRMDSPVYCMEGRNSSILCVLRDVIEHNEDVENPEPRSNIISLAYHRSLRRR